VMMQLFYQGLSSIRLSLCGGKEERRKNRLKTERVQFNQGNQSINQSCDVCNPLGFSFVVVGCWVLVIVVVS
jgi:hypothetical protein